jgi:uncharacterized membrane protein
VEKGRTDPQELPVDDEPASSPSPDSAVDSGSPQPSHWYLDPRAAGGRLVLSVSVGLLSTFLTPANIAWHVRAMVGWDAGALLFVVLAWLMILRASPATTRRRAAIEDPGRRLVFVIAIASSLFSLFAAVGVLRHVRALPPAHVQVWTCLALAAVALSWVATHTVFTLRYAHLYYRRHGPTECLRFPSNDPPCDLDFAYFAFTIGMCFQASDIIVATTRARRLVLLHSLVSFIYNTMILALSLNLVTTLLGGES